MTAEPAPIRPPAGYRTPAGYRPVRLELVVDAPVELTAYALSSLTLTALGVLTRTGSRVVSFSVRELDGETDALAGWPSEPPP